MILFRNSSLYALAIFVAWTTVYSQTKTQSISQPQELYNVWDKVLTKYADERGRLDYTALHASPQGLEEAYTYISKVSPDSHPELFLGEAAHFAYWLNAYNIATIHGVVKHYPISSVQDVKKFSAYSLFDGGGFFAAQKFKFGGKRSSLYKLENKIIRKRFKDPRLHFALNCASIGCPQLPQKAFRPEILEAQLERETRKFIRSSEKFQIDHAAKVIRISAIFDWYDKDFPNPTNAFKEVYLLNYIASYLSDIQKRALEQARQQAYTLEFLEYDWGLNDKK